MSKVVNFRVMPGRSALVFAAYFVTAALQCSGVGAAAQSAGVRDLTSGWRVPSEHISLSQTCENASSSIASDPVSHGQTNAKAEAKVLELTIISVSPSHLEIGGDFTATVRLKNVSLQAALVPRIADGEQIARVSAGETEEKYEVGDVSFRLLTGKNHRMPVFLNSGGALFADPDDRSSYLSLQPGNWLDLKLKATVECGLEECLGEIEPDSKAVLTAWWYQRVLTHSVNGCEEKHGSLTVSQVDSAPFEVVVAKSSPTSSAPGKK